MPCKRLLVVSIAALAAPAHALAEQDSRGWFATAFYSETKYDALLRADGIWWGDVEDRGGALAVGGGYDFIPRFGMRISYERPNGIHAVNQCPAGRICPAIAFREAAEVDSWSLVAMPRVRFADRWEFYGTVGVMHWRIDPDGVIASDNGTDFLYGAGIGYRFDNGFGIAAEYQKSETHSAAPALSLSFKF